MSSNYSIQIERTSQSRLSEIDFSTLKFGSIFSDHMLVAEYYDNAWQEVKIVPYGPLTISPAASALHYGQAIFEGIKGFKFEDGQISIFRPEENWKRFNRSAQRLQMPEVPQEIFLDGMDKLLEVDREWVPQKEGSSLYIRPLMFATEGHLGVHPSISYKFIIMTPRRS